LYAGTIRSGSYDSPNNDGGIYRSTNGGNEWLPPLDNTDATVWDLTVSNDGSVFAAAWNKGFLKSTDKGLTWNQINNGLNFREARKIIYNSITEHIFIHEPEYGVYMSTDLGAEWRARNDGTPSIFLYVQTFAFNPNTGMMFAGFDIYGGLVGGLYRSTQDNIPIEEPEEIPTTYSLSQNYPNPFNPTTKIQYSLPEASNVKLSVYNIMGQEMMQLVNESQSAGKYIVDFNAQNLPSGVYFYRLQTGKFVDTKKMLLIK
jgi:hypothetical protein